MVEAAGDIAKEAGFKRIKPRHIQLAFKNDDHMSNVFGNAHLYAGGVVPEKLPALEVLQQKPKRKAKKSAAK